MKVIVKLYAGLAPYLPPYADKNQFETEVDAEASIDQVFSNLGVPREMCHLVLVNGTYVAPSERTSRTLNAGDQLAAWPPVAGG